MKKRKKNKIKPNKLENKKFVNNKSENKNFKIHPFYIFIVIFAIIIICILIYIFMKSGTEDNNIANNNLPNNNNPTTPTTSNESDVNEVKTVEIISYNHTLINITGAKSMYDNDKSLVIIDFSIESIYKTGYIKGAINIPLDKLDSSIVSLDKNKKYLVYSRQTTTTLEGANKLASSGFPNIYRFEGNYGYWVLQGYPFERSY